MSLWHPPSDKSESPLRHLNSRSFKGWQSSPQQVLALVLNSERGREGGKDEEGGEGARERERESERI